MSEIAELQALLEAACDAADFPGPLRWHPMLGGVTGSAGERNFASLSAAGLALNLSKADREALLAEGAIPLRYEPDATRNKSAVVLPQRVLHDRAALAAWALRSARHVRALAPPKPRSARRPD